MEKNARHKNTFPLESYAVISACKVRKCVKVNEKTGRFFFYPTNLHVLTPASSFAF